MNRLRGLTAILVLLVAGCGAEPTGGPSSAASYGADDLVLRVDVSGGLVPVGLTVTGLPTLSVYGDGRVVTTGPMIEIYPAPALPNLQVQRISTADVAKLVDRAVDAGVGRQADLGMPNVADAPTTHLLVRTAAGEQVTDVPALGIAEDSLTGGQRDARERLRRLVEALTDLPATLGAGAVPAAQPFQPTGVAAVAVRWADTGGDPPLPPRPAQPWPGPALPGDPVTGQPSVHCVSATGEQATKILAAAGTANARTPWTSAGADWQVALRPLLPGEATCADLLRG